MNDGGQDMHNDASMPAVALNRLGYSNDVNTVLAHSPASISCLPITVFPIPSEGELEKDLFSVPRIFVAQQGFGDRWYQLGGRTRALKTAPTMIEIYERDLSFEHCSWKGAPGRTVMVEFADADVQAITHGEMQSLDLRTQHEFFHSRISSVTLELADEVTQGLPNGRLYVQGLCISLVALLAANCSTNTRSPGKDAARLGNVQRMRLIDLIHHNPGSDLSLVRLADEVRLSPQHLIRVFKATFGLTPHRYVHLRRLESAANALTSRSDLSISQIALENGFASQTHLTDSIRRHFGMTPRALRQAGRTDPEIVRHANDQ